LSVSVPLVPVTGRSRERLRALDASVSDLYRALANQPEYLEAWINFAWALRQRARTSRTLRELMILRSAQIHGAPYQWRDHVRMASEAGVSDDQISALKGWRSSALFDVPTRCALAFTEEMVRGRVKDETLEELAHHFAPDQRIELILTAGFYCMAPRVLDALRLVPTEED